MELIIGTERRTVLHDVRYLHRQEMDAVLVPRLDKQLAVPVPPIRNNRIHCMWIHQHSVRPAAEPVQRLEQHDRIAQVVAVGRILAVGVVFPIHVLVCHRRAVLRLGDAATAAHLGEEPDEERDACERGNRSASAP